MSGRSGEGGDGYVNQTRWSDPLLDDGALSTLKLYRTPRGFAFVPVHVTHDPDKAAPEWLAAAYAKYRRVEDAERELGINFSIHLGAMAYPGFLESTHVYPDHELPYHDRVPLDLWCDFNASPQAWGVSQLVGGWIHVLDDIFRDPSTIEAGVDQFREMYPNHKAEVRVYGDASVKTFYDTMRLHFRGYAAPVVFKVPVKNPPVKSRTLAVDAKLRPKSGFPGVRIRQSCVNLLADMREVVWRPDGKDLLKVSNPNDPYHLRTHSSDAFGYYIFREFPVIAEAAKFVAKAREPRPASAGRVLGDLHYKSRK